MYGLVLVSTGERFGESTWEHGGDAAAEATRVNAGFERCGSAERVRVTKLERELSAEEREAWRTREKARDPKAPWVEESWYLASKYRNLHFPYVANGDPSQVAFTPEEDWGVEDRQLRMRPGKYLSRYFGDVLDDVQIAEWVSRWDNEHNVRELKITQDADKIEWVYRNGPGSCMSYPAHDYHTGGIHPTRVYAGPDLAVAYILNGDDKPSSRVVVWPERKVHGCIYGDHDRMCHALAEEGYESGSLNGARVRRIETRDGEIVMPYVDGIYSAEEDGDYIRLGYGAISCDRTDGLGGPIYTCDRCHDGMCEEDATRMSNGDLWCYHCFEYNGAECEGCWEAYDVEDTTDVDGTYYCRCCRNNNASQCDECEEWHHNNDMHADAETGEPLCGDCHEQTHSCCFDCAEVFKMTDLSEAGECSECRAAKAEDEAAA